MIFCHSLNLLHFKLYIKNDFQLCRPTTSLINYTFFCVVFELLFLSPYLSMIRKSSLACTFSQAILCHTSQECARKWLPKNLLWIWIVVAEHREQSRQKKLFAHIKTQTDDVMWFNVEYMWEWEIGGTTAMSIFAAMAKSIKCHKINGKRINININQISFSRCMFLCVWMGKKQRYLKITDRRDSKIVDKQLLPSFFSLSTPLSLSPLLSLSLSCDKYLLTFLASKFDLFVQNFWRWIALVAVLTL